MPIPPSSSDVFTAGDLAEFGRRGLLLEDALDQIEKMSAPPVRARLRRPCRVGDGIIRLSDAAQADALHAHTEAARTGRVSHFLPASGAATRMFAELACLLEGDGTPGEPASGLADFFANLHRFPFEPALRQALVARGASMDELIASGARRPILEALLSTEGLGYASIPKGLVPFHRRGDRAVTAFEEHLAEASVVSACDGGVFRLHATVSAGHQALFETHLREILSRGALSPAATPDVVFSVQDPATDTLALDDAGRPARAADGSLMFRPAGHGALLHNLSMHAASSCPGGGVIFIKNIDNVAPHSRKVPTLHWCRVLLGLASQLHKETSRILDALGSGGSVDEAEDFVRNRLGLAIGRPSPAEPIKSTRTALMHLLDRPLRICGMVRNEGEPGGGPFWVADRARGESCQIIESAQVNPDAPEQARIFASGTHFNPVYMACVPLNRHGRPYDLTRFVDRNAVIIARKSVRGRPLTVLERPGLWNGAMAAWLTLFVEVPREVFNPVKTVNDLLRPAHQAE